MKLKKIVPRDPPWITTRLKMLNRKNRLSKKYRSHGYNDVDKVRLDAFRTVCQLAIETVLPKEFREQIEWAQYHPQFILRDH